MQENQCSDLVQELTEKKVQIAEILDNYDLPHKEIFDRLVEMHHTAKADAKRDRKKAPRTDLEHIRDVVMYLNKLLIPEFEAVLAWGSPEPQVSKDHDELMEIVKKLNGKSKRFLLCTALYHDIGKAIIRPRHGPEGADIIADSGVEDRKRFYALGLSRTDIYLMADLIRFHDYLAMVGTGETSYLTFVEVLYPITNISLIFEENFLDYLLLVNLADVAGSIGKIHPEVFMRLMRDFRLVKQAHNDISIKVHEDIFKEKPDKNDPELYRKTVPSQRHH